MLAYSRRVRGAAVAGDWPAEHGIDPGRIERVDKRPIGEYLELVQQADIALDPFPFNGHTTTCDSIWMGVPVVMLEGETYASRFGGSVLANVGLDDLIATIGRRVRRPGGRTGERSRTVWPNSACRTAAADGRLAAVGFRGLYAQRRAGISPNVAQVVHARRLTRADGDPIAMRNDVDSRKDEAVEGQWR